MSDRDEQRVRDAAELEKLGYVQVLLREMGGFSSFALSFSIISVLTGAVTLYGHGLRYGGPFVMSVGWLLATCMTLPVVASLAELASAYPTAGALYHWSAILGGRGSGFFTAWLNTIGQFAITAGIDYGLAEFVASMVGLPSDRAHVLPIYAAILVSHGALNHVGVRVVAILNWLSAWYHIAGVAILVLALAVLAPHQSSGFLFTRTTVAPEGYAYGFLIGLLQAQWTYTGYDASAHVTEETVDPARNAPWGMFLSVAVSGVVGYAMLLAVTLSIGNLGETVAADNPFIYVLTHALTPALGRALVWMVMGAMWFCGLGSVTSCSRMLFAFARDGGLPMSARVASISPRWRTPHIAVWITIVAAFALAASASGYAAIVALSTIALYASYGLPIAASLRARISGAIPRRGPWHLGRFSVALSVLALLWIAVITVLFVLPPDELAGYAFAGCIALLAIYWFGYMRFRFKGPSIGVSSSIEDPNDKGSAH